MQAQVEQALQAIDQGRFQKLINHLVSLKTNRPYFSPGTVVGKDKTSKGTPDSFLSMPDGTFTFVECTTQNYEANKEDFLEKLEKDIDKCFDESKTNITNKSISNVILAFTSKISPDEELRLKRKLESHSTTCQFLCYGIEYISTNILTYPSLANFYLNITFDSGMISDLNTFIKRSEKGFQPRLTNQFQFRVKEIQLIDEKLATQNILLLTGVPGVGKTKLACNYLDNFRIKNPETGIYVICNSSSKSIWDDLNRFLINNKSYIILFDDANRSTGTFSEVLNFIKMRQEDNIKLLVTVREYATDKVISILKSENTSFDLIQIKPFSNNEIKGIADSVLPEGKFFHQDIQNIISDIAKGNARLAMMAAQIAMSGSGLHKPNNSVDLYQTYFDPILAEIPALQDKNVFGALGIIAFFGTLSKTDQQVRAIIEESFKINFDNLWDNLRILSQEELVDIYEDEIIKISDQVLSAYAFYTVFINPKTKSFSYAELVKKTIKSHKSRLSETIIEINNTFHYNVIKDNISADLIHVQKHLSAEHELLNSFFQIYWLYRESDCLAYIQALISKTKSEKKSSFSYTYTPNSFFGKRDPILSILENFWMHPSDYLKLSLELASDYVFKQRTLMPFFVHMIKTDFAFNVKDYRWNYFRQHQLVDFLCSPAKTSDKAKVYNSILLEIAEIFLKTFYNYQGASNKKREVVFGHFQLKYTEHLISFRKKLLMKVTSLFSNNKEAVIKLTEFYAFEHEKFYPEIWAQEIPIFNSFIKKHFKSPTYRQSNFIYNYTVLLKKHSVIYPKTWDKIYNTDEYKTINILSEHREDHLEPDLEKMRLKKIQRLSTFFKGYTFNKYKSLIVFLEEAFPTEFKNSGYWLSDSLTELFLLELKNDQNLFIRLFEFYLKRGAKLQIRCSSLTYVALTSSKMNTERLYSLINDYEYPDKFQAQCTFFANLEAKDINPINLKRLVYLFKNTNANIYVFSFDFVHKFTSLFLKQKKIIKGASSAKNLITYLTKLLFEKKKVANLGFGPHLVSSSIDYYCKDLKEAKKVYFYMKNRDGHYDFDGKELKSIMDWDSNFFSEYLLEISKEKNFLPFNIDHVKLSFVWDYSDFEKVVTDSLDLLITKDILVSSMSCKANVLFVDLKNDVNKKAKALKFIDKYINKNSKSKLHLNRIMNVISYSFPDQIIPYFTKIIQAHKSLELLKSLWIAPSEMITDSRASSIDSEIILYRQAINAIGQLKNSKSYLKHIEYLNKYIESLEREKKVEERDDFIDGF